jgi:hypothetical protein
MIGHLYNIINGNINYYKNKNRQPKYLAGAPVCEKCGCDKPKIYVHGHYQCADCKCITDGDCCQGETQDAQ